MSVSTISSQHRSDLPCVATVPSASEILIPTISALALGIIYASNIPVGIAIGLGMFTVSTTAQLALQALHLVEEDPDNEYKNKLKKNPLLATLAAPLLEEGFFRGMIQPWATRLVIALVPTATAAFLGTGLSVATTVAIVATATLFGLIHAFNDHKNSHQQAAIATVAGVILGVTAVEFGLAAAIAAHSINNTLAMIALKLSDRQPTSATEAMSEFAGARV